MKTSIVIPCFNNHDYTQETLISIYETTDKEDIEIILIDNASEEKLEDNLENLSCFMNFKIIRNEENLGFPKAVNQGIRESTGDYICVSNNDLIYTPSWLNHLSWHLEHGLDIVGPRTNYCDGPQITLIDRYDSKIELYEKATEFYKQNKHKRWAYARLIGFCLLMKREVVDKIGLFDEIFSPGNWEDDDFILRAIEQGFKVGISKDVYIHHFGSVSFKALGAEFTNILLKNQKIFQSKWSDKKIKELEKVNEDRVNGKKNRKGD